MTPANDWATWRNQHFTGAEQTAGLANAGADPDSDNLSNLAEYALGANPRPHTAPLVTTLDPNNLSLTFTHPANLPGVRRCRIFGRHGHVGTGGVGIAGAGGDPDRAHPRLTHLGKPSPALPPPALRGTVTPGHGYAASALR